MVASPKKKAKGRSQSVRAAAPKAKAEAIGAKPGRRKGPASGAADGTADGPAPARISWTKDLSRSDRLMTYIDTNVQERTRHFSDSTKAAHDEERDPTAGKTTKMGFYAKIADAVFSVDADAKVRKDFKSNPDKYAKSVENYLNSLRKRYRETNSELGQTGAGLRLEDVVEGSDIHNKIQAIKISFPQWERLHGWWRTLPNYNPFTTSSEPGQDLAESAMDLFMGGGGSSAQAAEITLLDDDDEGDDDNPLSGWEVTPPKTRIGEQIDIDSDDHADAIGDPTSSPSPLPPLTLPAKSAAKRATTAKSKKGHHASSSTFASSTPSMTSAPASKKRSRKSAAAQDTDQVKALAQLGDQKHARRMKELEIKRERDRHTAEATAREAEHRRQREHEAHELQMMQMQMMMRAGSASGHYAGTYNYGGGYGTQPNTHGAQASGTMSQMMQSSIAPSTSGMHGQTHGPLLHYHDFSVFEDPKFLEQLGPDPGANPSSSLPRSTL
ncbi:hypothetical protein DFH08DRAFT_957668 [Mycena albidolilacea]|uniref:Uncharacterized protein n=1 Tax=Mycena albidolilacea TaxID=1033008 RepID=A0AAD7A8F4_9AGAR|nr:hypothetical protein DFH08DRAFT_957668 [Mycena albidolilacea]